MKSILKTINLIINSFFKLINDNKPLFTSIAKSILVLTGVIFFIYVTMISIEANASWIYLRFIIVSLIIVVIALIINWVINKAVFIPAFFRVSILISTLIIFIFSERDPIIVAYLLILFSLLGWLWDTLKRKKIISFSLKMKGAIAFVSLLVLFLIGYGVYFYRLPGIIPPKKLKAISYSSRISELDGIKSPSALGTYEVKTMSYGSGKDKHRDAYGKDVEIKTESIDCSEFIDNWSGINGWWRTKYWGFDPTEVPLNGRIWYPEVNNGPLPLVIIAHGDHSMQDYSDEGYAYLGELLASRGYIVVSIDENFLNIVWSYTTGALIDEIDARAIVMLEHLKLWHKWNNKKDNKFFNKVDVGNIALIGHSRGGEAVAHAAIFNELDNYPDNALVKFDYGFNIKSLIAIGAVDGFYRPSKELTQLENINYLALHGTYDGEVPFFRGVRQFKRVKFTDSLDYFKSAILIHGANHGQFNSSWGNKDSFNPFSGILNLKELLVKEEQEHIAKIFISGFLDTTIKKEKKYLPMFYDPKSVENWGVNTILFNEFKSSNSRYLCTFEEDFNTVTATMFKGEISTQNLTVWKEEKGKLGDKHLVLGWNNRMYEDDTSNVLFNIEFKNSIKKIDSNSVFVFSIREGNEVYNPILKQLKSNTNNVESINKVSDNNIENRLIDFSIVLTDNSGEKLSFLLSDFSYLQEQLKVPIIKTDYFINKFASTPMLQTYSFTVGEITKRNAKFNVKKITNISFVFNKTHKGVIVIDDIGFRNP